MPLSESDHYATLGLDRRCTETQIRAAYRLLAKQHHPDLNSGSAEALRRTQRLNAAYAVLGDPELRQAYDTTREAAERMSRKSRHGTKQGNISQDAHLRLEDFLRGATLEIRLRDPANANESELYELVVPPQTAPGTRFRVPREGNFAGSFVLVRVRPRPDFRFKARGSDLRCDLRIAVDRAAQGGSEMVGSLTGARLRLDIPRGVARGEILRLPGEGLPKARGGRGDLLVRILYRPEVRITRRPSR